MPSGFAARLTGHRDRFSATVTGRRPPSRPGGLLVPARLTGVSLPYEAQAAAVRSTLLRRDCMTPVRLQLHTLADNLGNFVRTLAAPEPIRDWSMTTLREKLIKIGAKVVGNTRFVGFQMAEVAIP